MKEALLTKIQKAVIYFVLYSVIGWCYEVFLEVVVYRWGFSNRGVLLGPYCVVYGFGALILIASLAERKTDLSGQGQCHAGAGLCRDCGHHYLGRIGRQLHHGIYPRGMAVGLHPLCL